MLTLKGGITCIESHKCWFPHVSCQVFRKVFWVGCRKCHHLLVWWQRRKYPAARDHHMFLLTNPLTGLSILHEALNWPSLMLSPMAHLAKAYPSFLSMKQIEILLPPPNLDGMLIYHKVTPSLLPLTFHQAPLTIHQYSFILLGGKRHDDSTVLPKNTTDPKPRPLDPESSTLTIGPQHLPQAYPLSPTSD